MGANVAILDDVDRGVYARLDGPRSLVAHLIAAAAPDLDAFAAHS